VAWTVPDGGRAGGRRVAGPAEADVAIVGGGPAGAALAIRLARLGHAVVVLERDPTWRWRAGGVFASPAAVPELRRLELAETALTELARPIPAMRVETQSGITFRLTYGAEDGGPPAVGFDRSRLDPVLLDAARAAGADVRLGTPITAVRSAGGVAVVHGPGVDLRARVVVGADGLRSVVARAHDAAHPAWLAPRLGLTYHLADPDGLVERDARMRLIRDGYIGIAPVPGGRVNVGIVLGPSWMPAVRHVGARSLAAELVRAIPPAPDDPATWREREPLDEVAGAWPVGHRVSRRSGPDWLLVGDAAGFLDPFTGEGLHRALVSAALAAAAIDAHLRERRGRSTNADVHLDLDRAPFAAYDRAMRRRFAGKDAVSWLVQVFLARPALFEYAARRVASRPRVRATMGLVMGDLIPASRALDPRYLAALLAP
jgi:menaquinone-9 beta-reductase